MAASSRMVLRQTRFLYRTIILLLAAAGVGVWYVFTLQASIEHDFQAYRSAAPSRVYARAPVLHLGMDVTATGLAQYLDRVGYRNVTDTELSPGEYLTGPAAWVIAVRPFVYANGAEAGGKVFVHLDREGRVSGLYSADGEELAPVHLEPAEIGAFVPADGKDRIPVRLGEIPRHLVDAVLITEDRRFFNHHGIDLNRIAGALLTNLRNHRIVEGASTITQQLAKNLYLTRERTLTRKLREIFIAILLEQHHSKQEILEAYLNVLFLGQDGATAIHGVGRAARFYFGRDIRDLGLAKCALLAALIRSPSNHEPFRHPEAAMERRNFVLEQMLEQKVITITEYQSAITAPLGLRTPFNPVHSAGYFLDYLRKELASRYSNRTLEEDGLAIYTTLDLRMQRLAERIVHTQLEKLEEDVEHLRQDGSPLQAAMVVQEPRTGQILAFIGGRDYLHSPFNRVLSRRQPGSIFKPVVALAALARGRDTSPLLTLASVIEDKPFHIAVPNTSWKPMNHYLGFSGAVTVREALERSMNVPFVHIGNTVGLTQIISTARRLGITSPLEPMPSLPLGTFEVTLLEIMRAYTVLASGGFRVPPRSVLRIVDPDGASQRLPEATPYRIFRAAEIYLVTSALQGSIDRGTSTYLRDLGYLGAAAGKTGSTNRFRDGWFVGYTPEIVIGVWTGFDNSRSMGISGAEAALPIAADFMIEVLGRHGSTRFVPPPGIERHRAAILKDTTCVHLTEYFLPGTVPKADCPESAVLPDRLDDEPS